MFARVRDFFVQQVLPTYKQFFGSRRENVFGEHRLLRHGIAAAGALYHLREHLPSPSPSVVSPRP
jgi:hypothetical protein